MAAMNYWNMPIDPKLQAAINPNEQVVYSFKGKCVTPKFMGEKEMNGQFVMTNYSLYFRGEADMMSMSTSLMDVASGKETMAIPFNTISNVSVKKNKVKIEYADPTKPGKTKKLKMRPRKEHGEDKNFYKQREAQFPGMFNELMARSRQG